MSDKENFMSFFDSIDKVNSEVTEDFSVENIQDEKTVIDFFDGIMKQKTVKDNNMNNSDQVEHEKNNLISEKSSKIDLNDETTKNKKKEATWFEGLLNNTTFFLKQAEEKVKQFQHLEGKKIEECVRHIMDIDTLEKFGSCFRSNAVPSLSSTFNSVLSVVAPPISLHEILEIEVYHNLNFFQEVSQIVYSTFDKAIFQIKDENIIVQKGKKNIMKTISEDKFYIFEGAQEAIKSAKTNIAPFLNSEKKEIIFSDSPSIHTSFVYLSILAYSFNLQNIPLSDTEKKNINGKERMLSFVIHLNDPQNEIELNTQSQALPIEWIDRLNNTNFKLFINDSLNQINEQIKKILQLSVEIIVQSYIEERNNKKSIKDKYQLTNIS
ncbi:hypothetical protein PCANB_000653 [Pneumocystis canis]|nr:hypothetical protein PCK1_000739 [Pneumocystis canis]KAG5437616.1 hypothetical protein PCANB_000653 [Pneumocystis canis]